MLAKQLQGSALATQPVFIEDTFSTHLYTGNGSTQTITNGIDLAGEGGMVWIKSRSAATNNFLFDTARGTTDELNSNTTDAEASLANSLTAFNADGFSIGSATGIGVNAATYASWTFRKQAKFFDVVTYTGNGSSPRAISHNLGSVPGCMIVKRTDTTGNWFVYHRSSAASGFTAAQCFMYLNLTNAVTDNSTIWGDTAPTSTQFTVGSSLNTNSATYVAYIFAHDAGGFGASGTDNVISCGSFTTDGSGQATVTLGYEPQFILYKASTTAQNWYIQDVMRGMPNPSANAAMLFPNLSNAESTDSKLAPTATGFFSGNAMLSGSQTYIYIAIRRGPMRTPTSGTSVFSPVVRTGTGSATTVSAGFPPDWGLCQGTATTIGNQVQDRLRGATLGLRTQTDAAETSSATDALTAFGQNGINVGAGTTSSYWNNSGVAYVNYFLRRAPGFFDVVCYTGTGSARTVSHNLGVAPKLLIVKRRSTANSWFVYEESTGNTKYLSLNGSGAADTSSTVWNDTSPTASVFSLGTNGAGNANNETYVAYLFATVAGVSKVGSYTGNGSNQTINCGFTAGSRFVMIKRTDSTGDWLVADTARGIVSGNDPLLRLNSTAAEVTTLDWIDPDNSGFVINQETTANANVNSASYIFLAIA